MVQMTLGDLADRTALPVMSDEHWAAMCHAMETIAGSTLMEFDNALVWAQWCRRTAADALTTSKKRDHA